MLLGGIVGGIARVNSQNYLLELIIFLKIYLGVHYPSDCIGGILVGYLVIGIGEIFNRYVNILGCPSCLENNCYSMLHEDSFHFVKRFCNSTFIY